MAVQPDGRILVAGSGEMVRLNPDGTLDTTFGASGIVTTDYAGGQASACAVAISPAGQVLLWGSDELARFNPDGLLDRTFGSDGIVTTKFYESSVQSTGLALQPDGDIVVVGGFAGSFAVARYLTDGSPDPNFGSDGETTVSFGGGRTETDVADSVTLQADGKLIIAGTRSGTQQGNPFVAFGVVRLDADGSPNASFGNGGLVTTQFSEAVDTAYQATVTPDGHVVVVGAAGQNDPVQGPEDVEFAVAEYQPGPVDQLVTVQDTPAPQGAPRLPTPASQPPFPTSRSPVAARRWQAFLTASACRPRAPNASSIVGWTVDWGDGTIGVPDSVYYPVADIVNGQVWHTYSNVGQTYNITVTATDGTNTYTAGGQAGASIPASAAAAW